MNKKPKKTKKAVQSKAAPVKRVPEESQEAAIQQLELAVSDLYKELPLAQTFASLTDKNQINSIIAALSGTLESLHLEELTQGLFPSAQEDANFAKELSSVVHGLKNLTTVVNKQMVKGAE
ncbi:hypothetical protein CpB0839 [Chlamydia pneumoniae TW-183]|uniref:Uncharacterized protein n=2 Tax=Chlamydia pneumoniae TaxID=83558 RepID=Q9Z796_CHLPN|nr:hypothetical protein [Chlamydia pneumoniae]AAD18948.1 CT577 hypothetical protein [Chlamydia pneumoniae CWL029]AAF38834.1 conserved hypothetical protein [Chlamydia pneumoniae AR39]AAP98768.1 hypothetical protein CpB0839 [Chlamydia pneumoniae TW-183]ACZ32701.1 conserved hypothetical protein [Chlamydia pneumoniae LPCoLN]ETR79589.1 hypothetical protein X556_1112 [Chlamydia pneumoniae B21]